MVVIDVLYFQSVVMVFEFVPVDMKYIMSTGDDRGLQTPRREVRCLGKSMLQKFGGELLSFTFVFVQLQTCYLFLRCTAQVVVLLALRDHVIDRDDPMASYKAVVSKSMRHHRQPVPA